MKKANYFIKLATFLTALLGVTASTAQSLTTTTSTTTTETVTNMGNRSYIGLSGGYLFKNKKLNENPMYHLKGGQFAEINLGSKGSLFGWSAALGYLQLKRDVPQMEAIHLNSQMLYDSAFGGAAIPPKVNSGLENNSLFIEKDDNMLLRKADFKGYYLLTGPNLWFDFNKVALNLALEAGVVYHQFGYYHNSGSAAAASGDLTINAVDPSGGSSDYSIALRSVTYTQYGMTEKYYEKVKNSTLSNPWDEAQPWEFSFMARASANVEYFVSPRISVHGGLNYWYLKSPKMAGQQEVMVESVVYQNANPKLEYRSAARYTDAFTSQDLSLLSANIGLKYWLGGDRSRTKTKTTTGSSASDIEKPMTKVEESRTAEAKSVRVTVVDQLTQTPMGEVKVVLKGKNGVADLSATTQSNGTVTFNNVQPGDYQVNGEIFHVATTSDRIAKKQFSEKDPIIPVTLEYNDPRFILKGVALNAANGHPEPDVKVMLDKENQKASEALTNAKGNFSFLLESNSDYQLQGLKQGLYSNTEMISTKGLSRSQTLYVTLKLGLEEVAVGKSFVIKNILYDYDKANIRSDAAVELNRIANFLKENPEVRIELSSHTDSRGSDAYNLALSQRRAQSAVNYLVAQGIARSRLVAKGYGEMRLLNHCGNGVECTEEAHQLNRRTEIEIIK